MTTLDLTAALRELQSPWLDAEAAAAYLRISVRHFRERVAVQPDFPQPSRRPGIGLRWDRRKLDEYLS
jgi:hypothetical protein